MWSLDRGECWNVNEDDFEVVVRRKVNAPPEPAEPVEEPKVLTVPEAARWLAVSRATLYRLMADGKVRSIKIGTRTRIPVSVIQDILEFGTEPEDRREA